MAVRLERFRSFRAHGKQLRRRSVSARFGSPRWPGRCRHGFVERSGLPVCALRCRCRWRRSEADHRKFESARGCRLRFGVASGLSRTSVSFGRGMCCRHATSVVCVWVLDERQRQEGIGRSDAARLLTRGILRGVCALWGARCRSSRSSDLFRSMWSRNTVNPVRQQVETDLQASCSRTAEVVENHEGGASAACSGCAKEGVFGPHPGRRRQGVMSTAGHPSERIPKRGGPLAWARVM